MPDNEHVPASLEEVISEIATILATMSPLSRPSGARSSSSIGGWFTL